MEIREVNTLEEARLCDTLLTKLISDEYQYNKLINPNFIVTNYFENIYMNDNNILLIAKEDNICGYIFVKEIDSEIDNIKVMLIDGLYVETEYRNKGIASSLIEVALEKCKEKNVTAVKIKVMTSNTSAVKLYEKYNFTEQAKEMINYL